VPDRAPYGAVYARVSSHLQAQRTSLSSQLRELLTRALEERLYVRPEHIFWEVHTGEELWERPELARMRGLFESHPFDCAYFYAVDRFARRTFYAELVLDEAHETSIETHFIVQQFEKTPEGRRVRHAAEDVAERELQALKERTARGKCERLRDGKPYGAGKPPYGYVWVMGRTRRGTDMRGSISTLWRRPSFNAFSPRSRKVAECEQSAAT
jgi:site-specific DNA recombinase